MKKLIAYIDAGKMVTDNLLNIAVDLQNRGIDELLVVNFTDDEAGREAFLDQARALSHKVDIPFAIGTFTARFEDTKKAFYTGASAVILRAQDIEGTTLLKESTDRFGEDNIYVLNGGRCVNLKGRTIVVDTGEVPSVEVMARMFFGYKEDTVIPESADAADSPDALAIRIGDIDVMDLKRRLAAFGVEINTFSTDVSFDELKTGADGLVPCIVQDYKTGEVLMMAYMDEEAYEATINTGIMTYHSRSRNELWIKGATSGHYQYLRELKADCDKDTLLAKVIQVGAACHTGSRSCFFNELIKHEYCEKDISKVLSSLYDVVVDRKFNPKEGSYTNYLFNKGIDKILKKCGEEATEMVIAAKNPNAEELKYEIADLMYHMTVLMVECGVDWQDVAGELANR